jgi:hypothetical protein
VAPRTLQEFLSQVKWEGDRVRDRPQQPTSTTGPAFRRPSTRTTWTLAGPSITGLTWPTGRASSAAFAAGTP